MDAQITKFLKEKLDEIKHELKLGGYDGRSFRGFSGDDEYAEYEIVEHLYQLEIWDGWTGYKEVTASPLWKQVIKYQGWYNSVA